MKHIKGMLVFIGLFILVGCAPDQEPTKQTTSGPQETKQVKQVTVTNQTTSAVEKQAPTKNDELIANQLTFDSHEYTYEVVTGATQTSIGTTPPAKYTPEEKKEKMFWSNQPPLGLMTGNYYKNEGVFTGGNYGIVEIITEPETQRILNVEFTEFASDPYYDTRYSGVNKRLSDYPEFQASNTRTDDTLVTVVNGITYVEKQMRDENRVTGNFYTVRGSSTSAREGLMPLAAEMDTWLKEPSKETYIGYAEDLGNGLIARLQVITEEQKIKHVSYDEYFSDEQEKITETALRPFYRQSKYYSPGYNKQTNNSFIHFVDALTKAITTQQTLSVNEEQELKHPSFTTYQRLAEKISTFQNSLKE